MKILALVTPNEITPKCQNEITLQIKYFYIISNRCDDFTNPQTKLYFLKHGAKDKQNQLSNKNRANECHKIYN